MSDDLNTYAFPVRYVDGNVQTGITMRDYFAVHFAEGLARHAAWSDDKTNEQNMRLVKTAYALADAMLAQRMTP